MLLFFLGLIAAVPIGIAVNLCTPWVQARLAARSSRRRQRQLAQLHKEMALVAKYRDGKSNLTVAFGTRFLIETIGNFAFAVIFNVVAAIALMSKGQNAAFFAFWFGIAGWVALVVAAAKAIRFEMFLRDIYDTERYDRKTRERLSKLGDQPGSPVSTDRNR